ncbi:tetratricopeptide repeat protein [Salmonella enterica]
MKKSSAVPPVPNKHVSSAQINNKIKLAADMLTTQPDKALKIINELIEQDKGNPLLWVIAGRAYQKQGEFVKAERAVNEALNIIPDYIEALNAKANILYQTERLVECEEYLRSTLVRINSEHSRPLRSLLATVLQKSKKYEQAQEIYQQLVKEDPNNWSFWCNLGMVNQELSRFDEMDAAYERSCELAKDNPLAWFNHIVGSHYHPQKSADDIMALCQAWQKKFPPISKISRAQAKNKTPAKRLRIGMISDGFRSHPVGNMITIGLTNIPDAEIEFYAYSTNYKDDHITHRIKRLCAKWQLIHGIPPEELDRQIREDEIDILFDLCGYNSNSQMQTLQLAPAPIQIKWVGGLISSTGLKTMDYLLSDAVETPQGFDALYSEKLIRLPGDYICYDPPFYIPAVNEPPVKRNGYITFGCFNNASKINDLLLEKWAAIMHEVPDSRLFLKSFNFKADMVKENVLAKMESFGISRERVRIEGYSPHVELLGCYHDVDIALDPWPYSGGLTTCEAMAMGVPVVTLPGPTFAGRHSASHLVNAGMQELVAGSWDQYINITVGLTHDLQSLSVIRQHLRDILLASPVCNGTQFGRSFSDAMRAIWQRYCEGKAPEALTMSADAPPYFHDDRQPVQLQQPSNTTVATAFQEYDSGFHFQINGKIIMMDYGARFARGDKFIRLDAMDAVHSIIMDITANVQESELPVRKRALQHIKLYALGDGEPVQVSFCIDPLLSSDLKPLAHQSTQQVVTEVVAQTSKLDEIHGLQTLDWFILDNKYDLRKAFTFGERILSNCLLLDIRVAFAPTHEGQMSFGEIAALLQQYGFVFRTFRRQELTPDLQTADGGMLPSSQMAAASAIFVPDSQRLAALSVERREKLAFILHVAYGMKDMTYSILQMNAQPRADKYLTTLNDADDEILAPAPSDKPASIIPELPRMSSDERALFESYIKNTGTYFEFGSGGSTKLATRNSVAVYGVESDKFWVDTLHKEAGPLCKVDYVDIGPTKAWGYPVDDSHKEKFPLYSEAILRFDHAFDFILVDGRFRVACTLNAIKHTLEKQGNIANTSIFIHDFWNRPDYHAVLEFLDVQDIVESAGVFKLKPNIDTAHLAERLEKYKYVAM